VTQNPEEGIAETLHELSDQTRNLVRREVNSALLEMWRKTRQGGPAVGLLAASGALAAFAVASSYQLSLRLLEKRLSPATAAAVATMGYGAAAAAAGVLGVRLLRQLPLPLPTETARETTQAVAEANQEVSPGSLPGRAARAFDR
jgi:Putative Actinobacterial Holin-X, holin superfamily III